MYKEWKKIVVQVKVKWSRYRPGVAQRVGRGIALLFHDRGTRRGWVVSSTPRPHFTPGKDPVPILQEAGWAPGPVWTGGKSRSHRDSILDRPIRSQSLYRLSYRAHNSDCVSGETVSERVVFYQHKPNLNGRKLKRRPRIVSSWDPVAGNWYQQGTERGTAVAQWLRCCATNRKVAGSIPAHVIGFFSDIKSLRSHYGPGVDSASNRNECQEHFLGVKAAGV